MILKLRKMCSPTTHGHTLVMRVVAVCVCLNVWTFPLLAQQGGSDDKIVLDAVTVTGKVTEVNGDPLPGVTIILENSPYGTASDIDGNFSLRIPTGGTMGSNILFGMIGMKTKTVKFHGQTSMVVTLEEDSHALDDVVVTGMATIKRGDMVGSYQKVDMDDILQPNYTTIDQMLQGQVAGMIVTNTGHRAGSPTNITIRGNATLIGNAEPLWVIDGIPQAESFSFSPQSNIFGEGNTQADINQYIGSQIAWLNPNDIQSVTVLKDASATAMYGSRATNGVIVIQTKKPEHGRFTVNFQSNVTINQRPNYGNYYLMNSQERIRFSQEAFAQGVYYNREPLAQLNTYEGAYAMFKTGQLSQQGFVDQYNRLETTNTDWFDLLMRNAVTQNYTVTLGGSSNNLSVNSSLGYTKQQGVEIGNDTERFTARVAATYTFSPTVKVDMAVWGAKATTNGFAAGVNPQSYAINTSRAIPAMDESGELVYYRTREYYAPNGDVNVKGLNYNILNERDNSGSVINSQTAAANLTLVWDILPQLRYELMGGYNSQIRDSEAYAGANTQYIARQYRGYDYGTAEPGSTEYLASVLPFGGELLTLNANQETYNLKNSLIYRQTFKDVHRVSGTVLWDVQSTHTRSKQNTVWGYDKERGETIAPPRLPEEIIPNDGSTSYLTSGYGVYSRLYDNGRWLSLRSTYNVMSVAALFTYNYDERYAVNINFRNDASNRFGQDVNHRFDPTYSFGVAWHLANEEFLRPVEWMDQLTLKATYGVQGNSMNNTSPDLIFSKSGISTVYNSYISRIDQLANPLLGWERTKSWNFGTDISLFHGRLTMTLEGYSRLTNAMNNAYLAIELGKKYSTPIKGNHLRNSGIESIVNVVALNQKDWRLNLSFNISKNWNKVTKISDIENITINVSQYLNGQDRLLLESDYGYGDFWAYSFAGIDPETGYPTFNNLEEENIDYTDLLVYAGNKYPSISGGLTASLSYKRFTLTGVFTGVTGGKTFLPNPYNGFYVGYMPEPTSNLSRELLDRWQRPGDDSTIPGVFTSTRRADINIDLPIAGSNESSDIYTMWAQSDARIVSNGFLKCRTLSLSWYDSSEFWQKAGIRNIRLSASMNNIFTIADKKWRGMDPETGGTYKDPRSYSIGLALGF